MSSGTDDETVPSCFYNRIREKMQVVHAENALDLSEEARQEPEITSRHPNQAGDHFREELFVWEGYADRCPFAFEQGLHLLCIERTELMNKADARVELRKRAIRFSMPGMPMSTKPAVPSSKMDRICSRLFM